MNKNDSRCVCPQLFKSQALKHSGGVIILINNKVNGKSMQQDEVGLQFDYYYFTRFFRLFSILKLSNRANVIA
jgi:hypothetical protein